MGFMLDMWHDTKPRKSDVESNRLDACVSTGPGEVFSSWKALGHSAEF